MANLGTPAALVAAASLTSYFELREELAPKPGESGVLQCLKATIFLLLITAFCCEICTVYITTVTGTMLLGSADRNGNTLIQTMAKSATGMLFRELEFEYLASRIGLF